MTEKKERVGKVIVKGLRLSFFAGYEPDKQKSDDGKIVEKWKANFLIPEDEIKGSSRELKAKFKGKWMPLKDALVKASEEAKEAKWGDKKNWPKMKPDRVFLRDGNLENWDGYENHWYISANAVLAEKPLVLTNRKDGNDNWIEAEPGGKNAPYSGCYVNGTIEVWCQDNEHGKRVNCKVKAVQFYSDGDPFGGAGPTDPNEDFDDDMVGEEGDLGDGDDNGGDDDDALV